MSKRRRGNSPQRVRDKSPGQQISATRSNDQLLPVPYRSKQSVSASAYTKSTLIADKVHSVDQSSFMTPRRPTSFSETPAVGPETARRLWRLGRTVDEATIQRNRAIVQAHRNGLSLRHIADLVGISHSGVDKITRRLSGTDVLTMWTTPVNCGKQTRYNFARTVPHTPASGSSIPAIRSCSRSTNPPMLPSRSTTTRT